MDPRALEQQTTTQSVQLSPGLVGSAQPLPGLVLIFAEERPAFRLFRVGSTPIELGRADLAEGDRSDSMISRQHLRVACEGTDFLVTDLNSHNGLFVAGQRISGETRVSAGNTIRVGGVLLLPVSDIGRFKDYGLGLDAGVVGGPSFRQALETVARIQGLGLVTCLLISGESGTGKELVAQAFHRVAGKPEAAFSALNCATIPKDLAERLLFGSRRGAFSGATDASGHVQAAQGGTLFLDEIAELPAEVQSKLLRMLETREVMRLGATRYEPVDVRVCAATWRNLRQEVAAGRFREDLYFRIAQPEVRLPALRDRIEEIPWHVQSVLDACGVQREFRATVGFIEACARRVWPGNVRELRSEVRRATATAAARGASSLTADDLSPLAGQCIERAAVERSPPGVPADEFAAALAGAGGNVLAAARSLGVHRNKVRRWLERHGVDPRSFRS